MNKPYMKVVTEKVEGGWRVRIVESDWSCVHVGWTLQSCAPNWFDTGCNVFKSRRAARLGLADYAKRYDCAIQITGGQH